jgi:endonuclease YncB( thermonuclease family)
MIQMFIIPPFLLLASAASAQMITGTAAVIDGDTIEVHGERIRLYGVDAVEGRQSSRLPDGKTWLCGADAAMALADRIGRNPVTCNQRDIDRYGRIVAVCWQGNMDLGEWLVVQGWAMAYRQYSTSYVSAESAARTARRGLWASDFAPPWEWRKSRRSGGG